MNESGRETNSFRDRLRGLGWFVASCQVLSQIISLAVLLMLYPRLGPKPFGLLAMALPAVTLGRLIAGFGLSTAGVARASLDEEAQSGLFWYGLGWAVVVAGGISVSGFGLAWFFAELALIQIVPALAITMVFSAAGLLHQIRLERAMRLSAVATIRVAALTLGGAVAIVTARLGGGVWALVAQQLVEWGMLTVGFWIAEPWLPRLTKPGAVALHTVRQGGAFTASSLAFWLAQNVDTLVVGRWGGPVQLGFYSQAYNLVMKPVLLVTTPLTAVMLPALSRVAHAPAEYRRLLGGFFQIVGLLLFPCGLGLFSLPVNVMDMLGGAGWGAGDPILRALAPLILMQGFINICGSVFASSGRFDRLLKGSLVYAALITCAVMAGAWWGTNAPERLDSTALHVAQCVTLATAVFVIPYLRYCLETVPMRSRPLLLALWPSAAASVAMAIGATLTGTAAIALANPLPRPWMATGVSILTGIIIYIILTHRELRRLLRSNRDQPNGSTD